MKLRAHSQVISCQLFGLRLYCIPATGKKKKGKKQKEGKTKVGSPTDLPPGGWDLGLFGNDQISNSARQGVHRSSKMCDQTGSTWKMENKAEKPILFVFSRFGTLTSYM